MERWQDRSWIPNDAERASVSALVEADAGQVLLRLLDQEQFYMLDTIFNHDIVPGRRQSPTARVCSKCPKQSSTG